jgi:hypothetical protein
MVPLAVLSSQTNFIFMEDNDKYSIDLRDLIIFLEKPI